MSSLRFYKIKKIKEARLNFRRNAKSLRLKFRNDIIAVRRTRLSRSLKRIYFRRIRSNFIIRFKKERNTYRKLLRFLWGLTTIPSVPTPAPAPAPAPTPTPTPTPDARKKKALLIGINYINTSSELRGCINDVNNIGNYLNTKSYSVTKITDYTSKKPNKSNIINEFTSFLKNSSSGDTLFFMYSGHGGSINDNNNDELDGKDECLIPIDGSIKDDELKEIIVNNLKPNVKLIALIDACHTGTMLDLKYQYLNDETSLILNNNIDTNGDVYMIGGSKDYQYSSDAYIENMYQGALSWAFRKIVQNNNNLNWEQLITDMRKILSDVGFSQITQFASGKPTNINEKIII